MTILLCLLLFVSTGWCLFIIPTWIILLPCALDVVCSCFALYLFMRPLNQMLHKINLNSNGTAKNLHKNKLALNVAQLITKLILLTSIAVITNLFGGIWFAVTDIALFSYIDTLINPVCLVLMEISNKDLYKFCCKYCHIGVHRMVHSKNESIKSRPFADLKVKKVESTTKERVNSISSPDNAAAVSDVKENQNEIGNTANNLVINVDLSVNASTEFADITPMTERTNTNSEFGVIPANGDISKKNMICPDVMKKEIQPNTPQSTRL